MLYPREVIQEVQALNDIVDLVGGYVQLSPRSGNHFGLCPFHNEKTPSFSVNKDKQIFYCFGCGEGGNSLSFIMKIENMDFVESLKFLAERVNYTLPEKGSSPTALKQAAERELSAEINKRAAKFYYEFLHKDTPEAKCAQEYLQARGVHPSLIKRFGLGLSPDIWDGLITALSPTPPANLLIAGLASQSKKDSERYYDRFRGRLMFPIIDSRGRVVGFGGRIMGNLKAEARHEAKYVNTPETPLFHKSDHLYGLNLAKKARTSEIIVVEGYMDVLAMHQAGFANTVGVLGTALTDSHTRLLRQAGCKNVVLLLDGDEAGIRAALRAIPMLTKGELKVRILRLVDAKDPDEYLQRFGAQKLAQVIASAKSHISFQIELLHTNHDLDTTDGRVGFTHDAAEILAGIPSAIETDAYIAEIAKTSGISKSAIQAEVEKISGKKFAQPQRNLLRTRIQSKPQVRHIKDAKNKLLHIILTNPTAALALKSSEYLSPDDMDEHTYTKLLGLAFNIAAENKQLAPADIFPESPDIQQTVAEIFANPEYFSSNADTLKALNEMAFVIKRNWALAQIELLKTKGDAIDIKSYTETLDLLNSQIKKKPEISI